MIENVERISDTQLKKLMERVKFGRWALIDLNQLYEILKEYKEMREIYKNLLVK